jgi:hypothetical protein
LQSKGACSPLIVHVVGESATSLSCARRLARGVSGGGADVGLSTHQSSKQAVQCLVECEHSSMHSLINRTTHATHCHTARPCHTCGCMRGLTMQRPLTAPGPPRARRRYVVNRRLGDALDVTRRGGPGGDLAFGARGSHSLPPPAAIELMVATSVVPATTNEAAVVRARVRTAHPTLPHAQPVTCRLRTHLSRCEHTCLVLTHTLENSHSIAH